MREGDAEELVDAAGRRSDEGALVKRNDRTSNMCGQDCGSCGADNNKRCTKKGHDRQRKGLAKCKEDL